MFYHMYLYHFTPLLIPNTNHSYTAVSSVLYGERLGLLQDYIDPEAQHFIDCITCMFKTTSPMLYIPPSLLRRIGSKVWKDHVDAWDGIFKHGTDADTTCSIILNLVKFICSYLHSHSGEVLFFNVTPFGFVSGPLYPKHLQAVTSGYGRGEEIPRSPG